MSNIDHGMNQITKNHKKGVKISNLAAQFHRKDASLANALPRKSEEHPELHDEVLPPGDFFEFEFPARILDFGSRILVLFHRPWGLSRGVLLGFLGVLLFLCG